MKAVLKTVLIASSIGFALATGSASAADLYPAKAPPPPASTWSGCYVNAGVGYGVWNQNHYNENYPSPLTPLTETVSTGGEGWLGRFGAGCDYQIGSRVVIGAFGDYDGMNLSGVLEDSYLNYFDCVAGTPLGGCVGNETERSAWGAGGRIGFLVTPKLLTYFDAGYTQANFSQINLVNIFPPSPASPLYYAAHTYSGWFVGGGTEYSLAGIMPCSPCGLDGLFFRTEYRYAAYGSADLPLLAGGVPVTGVGTPGGGLAQHMQKDVQTVTSGIVWKFNFGGSSCCAW
jgi:outer membrane immunogenic protein